MPVVGDAQEGTASVEPEAGRLPGTAGPRPPRPGVANGPASAAAVSVTAAGLMAVASIVGLVNPEVYPAGGWESFAANDAVNLVLGVPVLSAVAWWGSRGSLLATLAWPGALGYVAYNYVAYLVGLPVGWLSVAFLALVVLSVWGIVAVVRWVDRRAVADLLAGAVPVRFGGWAVLVFGVVFAGRAAAALAGGAPTRQEIGVLVADLVVSLVWVAAGVAMIRRSPAGHASGLGVLVLANLLFGGLVVFLLVEPVLTGTDPSVGDLVAVAAMWPVTLIPGVLYARGVASRAGSPVSAHVVVSRRP